jgi:hypothetical protein
MSEKNIILRIIEEVHYFKHHLLQSVVINDVQQTFLFLSSEKILDFNSLREYLLEKKINKFTKNEITTLMAKIDACLGLQEKYSKLPIEDCTYEYNYEGKGRALVFGRLKHTIVIKGAFWKSNSTEFDERISEFRYLNHFGIGGLMLRLRQIKDILAAESYFVNEDIFSSAHTNQYPLLFVSDNAYKCFNEYVKKHIIEFYTDYSYLKKRLEHEKIIHKHKDIDFINFLLNDLKIITDKNYEKFVVNDSKLKSLDKSRSEQRENNFNTVFKELL